MAFIAFRLQTCVKSNKTKKFINPSITMSCRPVEFKPGQLGVERQAPGARVHASTQHDNLCVCGQQEEGTAGQICGRVSRWAGKLEWVGGGGHKNTHTHSCCFVVL